MKLPAGYVAGEGLKTSTAYGGLGQRLMEHMGWKQGDGLGKNKTGMKKAIEVRKKDDALGVGAAPSWNWGAKHWEEAYNAAVTELNEHDDDSDCSTSSSDEEEGAVHTKSNRDGTRSTATIHEAKLAAALAKDPWGRFGGKEGKLARIREQERKLAEEAAKKLGIQTGLTSGAGASPVQARESGSNSERAEGRGEPEKKSKKRKEHEPDTQMGVEDADGNLGEGECAGTPASSKKRKKKEKGKKRSPGGEVVLLEAGERALSEQKKRRSKQGVSGDQADSGVSVEALPVSPPGTPALEEGPGAPCRLVIEVPQGDFAAPQVKATPLTGWWGAKWFISAGTLEGLQQEGAKAGAPPRGRQMFSEDDQEAVYLSVQDKQRQGKKGIGKSTQLKITGGKWEGTKKVFEDSENEGRPQSTERSGDADDDAQAVTEQEPAGQHSCASGAATDRCRSPSLKWSKLARQVLKEGEVQEMKWKKLWKKLQQVCNAAGVNGDDVLRTLAGSKKLEVTGKVVRMRS